MSKIICKECGIKKDRSEFYPNTGHICKPCKTAKGAENAKETKSFTKNALIQIMEMQKAMLTDITEMRDELHALRKRVKKMSDG